MKADLDFAGAFVVNRFPLRTPLFNAATSFGLGLWQVMPRDICLCFIQFL